MEKQQREYPTLSFRGFNERGYFMTSFKLDVSTANVDPILKLAG